MGLFVKKPVNLSQSLPYKIGLSDNTKLIVGLGNPGKKYDANRHNIGFNCLDYFATNNDYPQWQESKKFKGFISEARLGANRIILLKPTTYMNDSGLSVGAFINFYKIGNQDIVCVHDELSIPFGTIRSRVGGSDAGHNGIKSIISYIGEDFGRIRIGIKNKANSAELSNS